MPGLPIVPRFWRQSVHAHILSPNQTEMGSIASPFWVCENRSTRTAKIYASSSIRFSSHSLRLDFPASSKNACRTQRVVQ
jgi:hypothetical protein